MRKGQVNNPEGINQYSAGVRAAHKGAVSKYKSSAGIRKSFTKSINPIYRKELAMEIRAMRSGTSSYNKEVTLLRAIASQAGRRGKR